MASLSSSLLHLSPRTLLVLLLFMNQQRTVHCNPWNAVTISDLEYIPKFIQQTSDIILTRDFGRYVNDRSELLSADVDDRCKDKRAICYDLKSKGFVIVHRNTRSRHEAHPITGQSIVVLATGANSDEYPALIGGVNFEVIYNDLCTGRKSCNKPGIFKSELNIDSGQILADYEIEYPRPSENTRYPTKRVVHMQPGFRGIRSGQPFVYAAIDGLAAWKNGATRKGLEGRNWFYIIATDAQKLVYRVYHDDGNTHGESSSEVSGRRVVVNHPRAPTPAVRSTRNTAAGTSTIDTQSQASVVDAPSRARTRNASTQTSPVSSDRDSDDDDSDDEVYSNDMGYGAHYDMGYGAHHGMGYGAHNGKGYGAHHGMGYGAHNGMGYGAHYGMGYGAGYGGKGFGGAGGMMGYTGTNGYGGVNYYNDGGNIQNQNTVTRALKGEYDAAAASMMNPHIYNPQGMAVNYMTASGVNTAAGGYQRPINGFGYYYGKQNDRVRSRRRSRRSLRSIGDSYGTTTSTGSTADATTNTRRRSRKRGQHIHEHSKRYNNTMNNEYKHFLKKYRTHIEGNYRWDWKNITNYGNAPQWFKSHLAQNNGEHPTIAQAIAYMQYYHNGGQHGGNGNMPYASNPQLQKLFLALAPHQQRQLLALPPQQQLQHLYQIQQYYSASDNVKTYGGGGGGGGGYLNTGLYPGWQNQYSQYA
eukprot:Lankesteria_metandrocarpae@DN5233_c0_g1_i1.p1